MLTSKIKVFGKTIPVWIAGLALVAATAGAATGVVLAGSVRGEIVTTVSQSLLVDKTDVTGLDDTYATATLNFSGAVPGTYGTETVTITGSSGARVYTFKVGGFTDAINEVRIGSTQAATRDNLVAAINLAAGAGITYGSLTTINADVSAAVGSANTLVATAKAVGSPGAFTVAVTAPVGTWSAVTAGTGALKAAQFNAVSDDGTKFTAATEIQQSDGARINVVAVNKSTDTMAVLIRLDLMPGVTADIDGADDAGSSPSLSGTTYLGSGTGDSCVRISLTDWKCKLAPTAADGASDFRIKLALHDEILPGFYTTTVTMTQIENKS